MSSRFAYTALRARAAPLTMRAPRTTPILTRLYASASSADDDVVPPPLLQKLKGDLKTAMRAKDKDRLAVLRSVMSANLNASKTASPIRTDVQLVALMRRMAKSAEEAAAEARAAGREDLAEKEGAQIAVLNGYVQESGVATMTAGELRAAVETAVKEVKESGADDKAIMGLVMKKMNAVVEGKDVDKKELAGLVKEMSA